MGLNVEQRNAAVVARSAETAERRQSVEEALLAGSHTDQVLAKHEREMNNLQSLQQSADVEVTIYPSPTVSTCR